DHYIPARRVAPLHRVERALLVHIDQHAPLYRIPDARALDLARLEYYVAVGQDHRLPQGAQVLDRFERVRVQTILERILEHECRHLQQIRVVVEPDTEFLQRAQIIDIRELLAQRGQNGPISIAPIGAEGLFQAYAESGDEPTGAHKGLVDVQQEHGLACAQPGAVAS